jgi:signal transduction histidine kinase
MRMTGRARSEPDDDLDAADAAVLMAIAGELDTSARALRADDTAERAVDRGQLATRAARAAEGVRAAALRRDPLPARRLLALVVLRATQLELAGLTVTRTVGPVPAGLAPELVVVLEHSVACFIDNVLGHANARHVEVSLRTGEGVVELQVADDGCGFDTDDLDHPVPGAGVRSSELRLVRAAAAAVGGSFDVTTGLGRGTRVALRLPLQGVDLESLCSW